jgi:hypothetical protein
MEDFHVSLDGMTSRILQNQFMIHALNDLPTEYNIQLALLERRIGDKYKKLTVDEMRAELSLFFEILSMYSIKKWS